MVCPMSKAQQDVYRRVVLSHDYVVLRDSEVPCECRSGEPRKDCCHHVVPLDEVECFDTRQIRQVNPEKIVDGCVKWSHFMLVAIVQVSPASCTLYPPSWTLNRKNPELSNLKP